MLGCPHALHDTVSSVHGPSSLSPRSHSFKIAKNSLLSLFSQDQAQSDNQTACVTEIIVMMKKTHTVNDSDLDVPWWP